MATTEEAEITDPVSLCDSDGKHLNPAAKGWSRLPMHDCNLRGVWGRTKRWDYWAVLSDRFLVSITYADVDYLGIASVWWADLETGEQGGHDTNVPLARGIELPDRPGSRSLSHGSTSSNIELVEEAEGTRLRATWAERDGRPAEVDILVEQPEGHESLNVVIPWSARRFQYTSKHQARPAHGFLRIGDEQHVLGGGRPEHAVGSGSGAARADESSEAHGTLPNKEGADDEQAAWGVLDVGRGRWPYRTRWNWGGGAGVAGDGATIGLQFGGKWTEGTGFTENGVIVDGRLTKIGTELRWDYEWNDPLRPWTVTHPDGSLELTLTPTFDRHSKVEALVMGTEVHQVFGRWSGHVTDDTGRRHDLDGALGFAEESRSRW